MEVIDAFKNFVDGMFIGVCIGTLLIGALLWLDEKFDIFDWDEE